MRALIVRHSSIGDIVHTLPALAALRKQGFLVSWVAEPPGLDLLERNPGLEQVVRAPAVKAWRASEAWDALRRLRRQRFEVALDFGTASHDDRIGGIVAKALRATAQQTGDPSDEIEKWRRIDKAQQVSNHDLAELQAQALLVDDAETKQPLSDGLPSPKPLHENAIAD